MSELLLVLILGHFMADYWFQTTKIVKLKTSEDFKVKIFGLSIHVFIHLITYVLIVSLIHKLSSKLFVCLLFIVLLHFITDFIKELLNQFVCKHVFSRVCAYIFDQIVHVFTIIGVLTYFKMINYDLDVWKEFINALLFEKEITLSHLDKFFAFLIVIIITTHFSAYFLENLLDDIKPLNNSFVDSKTEMKNVKTMKRHGKHLELSPIEENTVEETLVHTHYAEPQFKIGKYIGMIERIIIMILVSINAYTGITFLAALKALTRFKQFEDKRFAEYYLIGNLLSMLIGIISGYLITLILK
nr:DUF3307 domain-containing protein [Bacillus thuringiensis]MCG3426995.1 DUF3307 domain-containing protein [Bacillus thuringiensis]